MSLQPRWFCRWACLLCGLSLLPCVAMQRSAASAQTAPAPTPQAQELDRLIQQIIKEIEVRDFVSAEKDARDGLAQAQALPDDRRAATFLFHLGRLFVRQEKLDQGLDYHTQAYNLRLKLGFDEDTMNSLISLGIIHRDLRQFDKALDDFNQALTIAQKLDQPERISACLEHLGITYRRMSDLDKALDYYQRALEIDAKLNDPLNLAHSLENVGLVTERLGQLDKALDMRTRSLALREQIGDKQEIVYGLNSLGIVYGQLGQYDKALEAFSRTLPLNQELLKDPRLENDPVLLRKRHLDLGNSYGNMGIIYDNLGEIDLALDFYLQGLSQRESVQTSTPFAEVEKGEYVGGSLANIGNLYQTIHQCETALDYYQRARPLLEKAGDTGELAELYGEIGQAYQELGDMEQAREFLEMSLRYNEKVGNPQNIATSNLNLGAYYHHRKRLDIALSYYTRALVNNEKTGDKQSRALNYNSLGNVYLDQGQFARALAEHTRALRLYREVGNKRDIAESYSDLGLVYERMKQWDKAEEAYRQAVRVLEEFGLQVSDPSQWGTLQKSGKRIYARYARLLASRKRYEEALVVAERGRGQGLAKQAAQCRANLDRYFSAEDAAALQKRTEELTVANSLLRAALSQDVPASVEGQRRLSAQVASAKDRFDKAQNQYTLFRHDLYTRYPSYRRVQGESPLTTAQIRAFARRHPDTLFLEWTLVDDTTTLLFALSAREGVRLVSLPVGEATLQKQAAQWQRALRNREKREPELAHQLYRALLEPFEKGQSNSPPHPQVWGTRSVRTTSLPPNLGVGGELAAGGRSSSVSPGQQRYSRLMLIGDGPLNDIPFAALRDGQGKRLIERYALASCISLSILNWPTNQARPSALLLCAADPTGEGGSVVQSRTRGGLRPLPAARREGRAVVRMFPGAVGLIGSEAHESVIKQQMDHYAILHFATHGVADPINGLRSCLVLSPDAKDDGFLEAREIVERPLSAQLAVLSACETAQGQQSGEGLLGLAWAFRAAGCPSVIASQWEVDDEATGRLMVDFYRGVKAGQRKDDALRKAMLTVKRTPARAAPYYWAAFALFGDADRLPALH